MGSAPKSTSRPQTVDVRTPGERQLAEQQSQYFSGLMGQEDFGYQDISSAFEPLRQREEERFKQGVTGSAADLGFSPQGSGLAASEISKGLRRRSEFETGRQAEERDRWRRWVISGGRQAATPTGRQVGQVSQSQGASPWASGLGYLGGAAAGAGISRL